MRAPRSRPTTTTSSCSRTVSRRSGRPIRRGSRRRRRSVAATTGDRPLRGRRVHPRPRRPVRRPLRVPGAHRHRCARRPRRRVVAAAGRRAGLLFREPRCGNRCDTAASARTDLRLPVRPAALAGLARPRPRASPADREVAAGRHPRRRTTRRHQARVLRRRVVGLRSRRGTLAVRCTSSRTATSPVSPPSTSTNATNSPASSGTCSAASTGSSPESTAPLHRRLAPGTGRCTSWGRATVLPDLLVAPRPGQAEISRRVRIRDGRVDQRHHPRTDRRTLREVAP